MLPESQLASRIRRQSTSQDEGHKGRWTPVLHSYRKRKFFYELAHLLGEDPPVIQQSAPMPLAVSSPVLATTSTVLQCHAEHTESSSSATRVSSSVGSEEGTVQVAVNRSLVLSEITEEEELPFEYIEFDGLQDALAHSRSSHRTLPSQGSTSTYGSTQDSACLVPISGNTLAAFRVAHWLPL